jgi:hypothetical protein
VALIRIVIAVPLVQVGDALQSVVAPPPDFVAPVQEPPLFNEYSQVDIAEPLSLNLAVRSKGESRNIPDSIFEATGPETTEGGVRTNGV